MGEWSRTRISSQFLSNNIDPAYSFILIALKQAAGLSKYMYLLHFGERSFGLVYVSTVY